MLGYGVYCQKFNNETSYYLVKIYQHQQLLTFSSKVLGSTSRTAKRSGTQMVGLRANTATWIQMAFCESLNTSLIKGVTGKSLSTFLASHYISRANNSPFAQVSPDDSQPKQRQFSLLHRANSASLVGEGEKRRFCWQMRAFVKRKAADKRLFALCTRSRKDSQSKYFIATTRHICSRTHPL